MPDSGKNAAPGARQWSGASNWFVDAFAFYFDDLQSITVVRVLNLITRFFQVEFYFIYSIQDQCNLKFDDTVKAPPFPRVALCFVHALPYTFLLATVCIWSDC